MTTPWLAKLNPTDEPLLTLACQNVDDSMLREIAIADYSQDVDAHFKALKAIQNGHISAPMKWEPQEVLELIRWSEPDDRTITAQSYGERAHWMRLFSCAVLLRSGAEPGGYEACCGNGDTIIQLVESALALGENTTKAALQFFGWAMQQHRVEEDGEQAYYAIAALLLLISLDRCESQMTEHLVNMAQSEENGLFSNLLKYCLRGKKWKALIQKTMINSEAATDYTKLFGYELCELSL